MEFDKEQIVKLGDALIESLNTIYQSKRPIPDNLPELPTIPDEGRGVTALPELWSQLIEGSTKLASPNMIGHMDTAPHPAAALSEAIVSALNNNLLFRELSPLASHIEEIVIDDLRRRAELSEKWTGIFVSGGSIANLTALFAASGGFANADDRGRVRLFVSEATHASIKKSAALLGLSSDHVITVPGDDCGRMYPNELESLLQKSQNTKNIVVAVLGTTIHGAVDHIEEIGRITQHVGAWLHIDAIYGGAVIFSESNRQFLNGLEAANSIVMGPQKWMYVPRLSAIVYIKGEMDERLGVDLPYSVTGEPHRGRWGLQGSRRADAVTLWLLLQVIGTKTLGRWVDQTIEITRMFNGVLNKHPDLTASHEPDLNLQCFRVTRELNDDQVLKVHQALTKSGGPWVSLSRWRDELLFRAVLLPPSTRLRDLEALLKAINSAIKRTLQKF